MASLRTPNLPTGLVLVTLALLGSAGRAGAEPLPGDVIYDFATNAGRCDPDEFTFFGNAQIAFGHTTDSEDGNGAYQLVDWTLCDETLPDPANDCAWAGAAIGLDGAFTNCADDPADAGIHDANLDLSQGTGLSVRVRMELEEDLGGTLGTRMALILTDADGTTAATPGNVDAAGQFVDIHDAVNRRIPLSENWTTLKFLFEQLTWAWDDDHSVIGTVPGLDLTHVKEMKLFWYRQSAAGAMTYLFDEIALVDDVPAPYFDTDGDADIDLADFAHFQNCLPAGLDEPGCEGLDSDYSGTLNTTDLHVLTSCLAGPGCIDEIYPWCY